MFEELGNGLSQGQVQVWGYKTRRETDMEYFVKANSKLELNRTTTLKKYQEAASDEELS